VDLKINFLLGAI
jgi:hypothetical protein